jgi:hypothetical protein
MQDTLDALYEEWEYLEAIAAELGEDPDYKRIEAIKREINEAESLGSRWG